MKPRAFRSGVCCAVLLLVASAPAPPEPSADRAAQKQTIADIRNVGTAMFSWLTDQVSAGAAGQSQTPKTVTACFQQYPPISRAELVKILAPDYLQEVPETDGWGHPYEFCLNVADPLAKEVMSIRSPGRDGIFSTTDYTLSSFKTDDFDEDIVWIDGFFARWPGAAEVGLRPGK